MDMYCLGKNSEHYYSEGKDNNMTGNCKIIIIVCLAGLISISPAISSEKKNGAKAGGMINKGMSSKSATTLSIASGWPPSADSRKPKKSSKICPSGHKQGWAGEFWRIYSPAIRVPGAFTEMRSVYYKILESCKSQFAPDLLAIFYFTESCCFIIPSEVSFYR